MAKTTRLYVARLKHRLGLLLLCLSFSGVVSASDALQPDTIHIASHELPPYHWLNADDQLVGPAYTSLSCIFDRLKQKFDIKVYPWPRAQELVRHQLSDGFFIASQNDKRDGYARFASPFYYDEWYFYSHRGRVFSVNDEDIKGRYLGVLRGSNMEQWAKKHGYDNLLSAQDYAHLFKILKLERLDIVMATKGIFRAQIAAQGLDQEEFVAEKIRNLDMGIYFGNHFLAAYPSYIQRFNQASVFCRSQQASMN